MTCTEQIAAAHVMHLVSVALDGKLHLSALTAFGEGYDSCLPAASAPVLGSACCVVQSHLLPPLSHGTTVHRYSMTKRILWMASDICMCFTKDGLVELDCFQTRTIMLSA